MVIHSMKANQDCKDEKKLFNLCRANIINKHVNASICE